LRVFLPSCDNNSKVINLSDASTSGISITLAEYKLKPSLTFLTSSTFTLTIEPISTFSLVLRAFPTFRYSLPSKSVVL